jgi:hypothetical protein
MEMPPLFDEQPIQKFKEKPINLEALFAGGNPTN